MGDICAVSEQKLIHIKQKTVMFELFLTFSNFYKRMLKKKKKFNFSQNRYFLMSNISKGFKYKNLAY